MGQAVGIIFAVGCFAIGILNILSSSRSPKYWGDVEICYGEN